MSKITVQGTEITVIQIDNEDYICLTDMVRNFENGEFFILNWLRTIANPIMNVRGQRYTPSAW